MKSVIAVMATIIIAATGFPATIYVPDNYPKIQDALAAAATGDTIIVRSGRYVENINLLGKEVHLRSEDGPAATVIDGGDRDTVVRIDGGEGPACVLEGFTITNGRNTDVGTQSQGDGGGITIVYSSPTISGNWILGNVSQHDANGHSGGGLCSVGGGPTIVGNVFRGNYAAKGGGLRIHGGTVSVVEGNLFERNLAVDLINAGSAGGGAMVEGACLVQDNLFLYNKTEWRGGGLEASASVNSPTIVDNVFIGNHGSEGGGLSVSGRQHSPADEVLVAGNLIYANSVSDIPVNPGGSRGGGICWIGKVHVVNTTIVNNTAIQDGGGIAASSGSTYGRVVNSIVWGNVPSQLWMPNSHVTVDHSDVEGGWTGTGNFDADPQFVDLAKGDLHITWDSPCRNLGTNGAPGLPTLDFEGDPRIHDVTVDVGFDEFHYHLYKTGAVVPGSGLVIKIVGQPGKPALLAMGNGIQDPPQSTSHGDLWLTLPLAQSWQLGKIPGRGVRSFPATVPSSWVVGSQHPFQGLVGPWGGSDSNLTNLMLLTTE